MWLLLAPLLIGPEAVRGDAPSPTIPLALYMLFDDGEFQLQFLGLVALAPEKLYPSGGQQIFSLGNQQETRHTFVDFPQTAQISPGRDCAKGTQWAERSWSCSN